MRHQTLSWIPLRAALAIGAPIATTLLGLSLSAQPPGSAPPPVAKAVAPIDLTGYWVSIVTEDWRYRMVMPAAGDYQGVPMTAAALKVAREWASGKGQDPCNAYGAPALLRVPERLHITWQDDQTMRMDTDAGKQTRIFHFGEWKAPAGPHTLQGDSTAQWEFHRPQGSGTPRNGSLKVATVNLKAGYLRKNGVPYSENATLMEYFDLVKGASGSILMVATIVVTDPLYLREPFIISSHFRKQTSDAGWTPTQCSANW